MELDRGGRIPAIIVEKDYIRKTIVNSCEVRAMYCT